MDFPFDAIEKLRNLEAFTLEKSRVRLLPRFNGLNRLKHIRIDGSLISGFPVGAFANMASVKQIHVVNSDVTTLAEGIFGRLENLVLANFSNNRIDHIQRRCFALLPRLEVSRRLRARALYIHLLILFFSFDYKTNALILLICLIVYFFALCGHCIRLFSINENITGCFSQTFFQFV